jgi:predicted PurR-regulated permease PerM
MNFFPSMLLIICASLITKGMKRLKSPKKMSRINKSVKAHPVEIFLVVIAAASIGGITGMIVAVPVYGFVKIVAIEFMHNFRLVRKIP